jgi:hypothetical protein
MKNQKGAVIGLETLGDAEIAVKFDAAIKICQPIEVPV